MFEALTTEAQLRSHHNMLLVLSPIEETSLLQDFFGHVLRLEELRSTPDRVASKRVYLCGDLSRLQQHELHTAEQLIVIRQLSTQILPAHDTLVSHVDLGRVPISVAGLGVYYRRFFDTGINYFQHICAEHTFQSLTESNKPAKAHRTGIYLTEVVPDGDTLRFHLLRCSTNLSGPTETFRATDRQIVDALNHEAERVFDRASPLNHVLAQVYHNVPASASHKQAKARISEHADKTKDMPAQGIMAFCTFYDQLHKLRPLARDRFDLGYKETSGLTRLHFRLKESVVDRSQLPSEFTITLYPHSVFFMPLSTNRLYTHEIQSSILDAERLPTRLGYVVRCSKTQAVHANGQTSLERDGTLFPLQPPSPEGTLELRKLYAEENKSHAVIAYGDQFDFSMNQGDYLAPQWYPSDAFRVYQLPRELDFFSTLQLGIELEELGKGRRGTVLVAPCPDKSIPLVRTTTRYTTQPFVFREAHAQLAQQIRERASIRHALNNALIEIYADSYTSMASHSDQALDLDADSEIVLFSCYNHPDRLESPRKLIVESKTNQDQSFEVLLEHHSLVVFSVATNQQFKHRIVGNKHSHASENLWLGVTFRTSKTFVRNELETMRFSDGTALTLATDEQAKEFFQLRARENRETAFVYPRLHYTLSPSDLRSPR